MDEVCKRLEQAEDGSLELDAAVEDALAQGDDRQSLPYTRSVDAALTLVHPDLDFGLAREGGYWSAWCVEPKGWFTRVPHQHARRPALAICLAALSARKSRSI